MNTRRGVGRHRGADELLEGSFVDLLPFTEVDRTLRDPQPFYLSSFRAKGGLAYSLAIFKRPVILSEAKGRVEGPALAVVLAVACS